MESFLRGATSYADQMFLLKRGLLEVKEKKKRKANLNTILIPPVP